jgi:hypothetical protein
MKETLMLLFKGDAVPYAYQVKLKTYLRFSHLQSQILIEKGAVIQGISDYDSAIRA